MKVIDRLQSALSSDVPESLISRDRWRLDENYYGPLARAGSLGTHGVFLGAGSGLYPLLFAHEYPRRRIFIEEPIHEIRGAILGVIQFMGLENAFVFQDRAVLLGQLQAETAGISHLVVAEECCTEDVFTAFDGLGPIDVLLGAFDECRINPLWLHRWSRRNARRFYWQNESLWQADGQNYPVVGAAFEGPDVTVIVPAHGAEARLDQCLSSLSAQTLADFEVLVIDDGLRQGALEIVAEWAKRDERIRVIHSSNKGFAPARSCGLMAAKGYWVGFVDDEDWVDAAMFQALAESSARFTSDIAQCEYLRFSDREQVLDHEDEVPRLCVAVGPKSGLIADPKDLIASGPSIWRRLYRRDFLQDSGLSFHSDVPRLDDLVFQFMTLALAHRVSVVGAPYYFYRQERSEQAISVTDQRLHVYFSTFTALKAFVLQNHSAPLESLLFGTQLAFHEWALSVIDEKLRRVYLKAARYDLFENDWILSRSELMKASRVFGPSRFRLARQLRRQFGSGLSEYQTLTKTN